jgi:hypothetical protein
MRKLWIPAVLMVLAVGLIAQASSAGGGPDSTVLRFKTMVGTVAPYTGAANAIRGIPGAGSPWSIDKANGTLKENGDLSVKVKGLIITGTGANPVPTFRAVVSCQSIAGGAAVTCEPCHGAVPRHHEWRCRVQGQCGSAEPLHRADRVRHDRNRRSAGLVLGHRSLTAGGTHDRADPAEARVGVPRGTQHVERGGRLAAPFTAERGRLRRAPAAVREDIERVLEAAAIRAAAAAPRGRPDSAVTSGSSTAGSSITSHRPLRQPPRNSLSRRAHSTSTRRPHLRRSQPRTSCTPATAARSWSPTLSPRDHAGTAS